MTQNTPCVENRSKMLNAGHAEGRDPAYAVVPSISSHQLLGGQRAVTIEHEGVQYVLRATRNGKLILTK